LDELILFSYYWVNRHRYKKVLDLGANLGLHSIFLAKCGYDVTAYEPDPRHKDILAKNLQLNGIENVTIKKKAISDKTGKMDFIRVLGNTTSSHLAGAKDNPYGELKKLTVHVDALRDAIIGVDFVKMDIEGNEAKAICSISSSDWGDLEMMLEVGSEKNAIEIFEHAQQIGLNVFTQQKGWTKAETLSDVPTSYYEGSLFLTKRPLIFWG
jgi:FkbM family methyltransferase